MSEKKNEHKDIDLLKVELLSDHRTGWFLVAAGAYLTLTITLLLTWYQRFQGVSNPGIEYYAGVGFFGAFIVVWFLFREARPYQKHVKQIDALLKRIEEGERIPAFADLFADKNRRQSIGNDILIILILSAIVLVINDLFTAGVAIGFIIAGLFVIIATRSKSGSKRPKIPKSGHAA